MHKKILFFICIQFIFISCSDKTPEIEVESANMPILTYDAEISESLTLDKKNIYIDAARDVSFWSQHFQNPKNNLNNILSKSNFKNKSKLRSNKSGPINIIQPIVFENNLCRLANNGFFECLNYESKEILFSKDIKKENVKKYELYRGGLAYFDDKVVLVDAYGQVILFNSINGEIIWNIEVGMPILSPPLIYRNYIFFTTSDNRIFSIDFETGEISWTFQTIVEAKKNLFTASPIAFENLVIVPFSNGELVAFTYDNGRPIWSENLSKISMLSNFDIKDISASPVISGSSIYALSTNGKFVSLNAVNGQRNWSINLSGSRTPIVSGGQIYVINDEGQLVCLDKMSGEIYWITDLGKYKSEKNMKNMNMWLGPYLINNQLYNISYFGQIKTVSPFTGEIIEEDKLGVKELIVPPILLTETILLTDKNANVFRFE